MRNRHWREMVEIVGVVGIVASMILVAAELREANRQTAAQAELEILAQHNLISAARAADADFAKLFPKLEAPESHLITATDASQMRGIARHNVNVLRSVQRAYKHDLISTRVRNMVVNDLAYTLEAWPGIRPHYVEIYRATEAIQGAAEFAPITEYIDAADVPPADN